MIARYGRLLVLVTLAIVGLVLLGGARFWERSEGRLPPANPRIAAATPAVPTPAVGTPAATGATGAAASAARSGAVSTQAAAMKALQESLERDPKNAATWREVGRLLGERKDYSGAAEAFAAAVELAPQDARFRNDLGSALLYLGLVRVSRAQFERSVALDGSFPDARFNLAITMSHTEPSDTAGALREWRLVVEMAPGTEVAKMAQGYIDEYSGAKKPGVPSPHGTPSATPASPRGN